MDMYIIGVCDQLAESRSCTQGAGASHRTAKALLLRIVSAREWRPALLACRDLLDRPIRPQYALYLH